MGEGSGSVSLTPQQGFVWSIFEVDGEGKSSYSGAQYVADCDEFQIKKVESLQTEATAAKLCKFLEYYFYDLFKSYADRHTFVQMIGDVDNLVDYAPESDKPMDRLKYTMERVVLFCCSHFFYAPDHSVPSEVLSKMKKKFSNCVVEFKLSDEKLSLQGSVSSGVVHVAEGGQLAETASQKFEEAMPLVLRCCKVFARAYLAPMTPAGMRLDFISEQQSSAWSALGKLQLALPVRKFIVDNFSDFFPFFPLRRDFVKSMNDVFSDAGTIESDSRSLQSYFYQAHLISGNFKPLPDGEKQSLRGKMDLHYPKEEVRREGEIDAVVEAVLKSVEAYVKRFEGFSASDLYHCLDHLPTDYWETFVEAAKWLVPSLPHGYIYYLPSYQTLPDIMSMKLDKALKGATRHMATLVFNEGPLQEVEVEESSPQASRRDELAVAEAVEDLLGKDFASEGVKRKATQPSDGLKEKLKNCLAILRCKILASYVEKQLLEKRSKMDEYHKRVEHFRAFLVKEGVLPEKKEQPADPPQESEDRGGESSLSESPSLSGADVRGLMAESSRALQEAKALTEFEIDEADPIKKSMQEAYQSVFNEIEELDKKVQKLSGELQWLLDRKEEAHGAHPINTDLIVTYDEGAYLMQVDALYAHPEVVADLLDAYIYYSYASWNTLSYDRYSALNAATTGVARWATGFLYKTDEVYNKYR